MLEPLQLSFSLDTHLEILHHIIDFLDPLTIYKLIKVNKTIKDYIYSKKYSIFQRILLNEYPHQTKESSVYLAKDVYFKLLIEDIVSNIEMTLNNIEPIPSYGYSKIIILGRKIKICTMWGRKWGIETNYLDNYLRRIYNRLFFYENQVNMKYVKLLPYIFIKNNANFTLDTFLLAIDTYDLKSIREMIKKKPEMLNETIDSIPLLFYLKQSLALYYSFKVNFNTKRHFFLKKVIKWLVSKNEKVIFENQDLDSFFKDKISEYKNQLLFIRAKN
jgi:hypothetical protein